MEQPGPYIVYIWLDICQTTIEYRGISRSSKFLMIDRERAIEKAQKMESHIGYPKELLNDTKLTELYNGVS
jgi:hypothetical protein